MKVCDALLKECKCNPTLGFYCKDPRKQAEQRLDVVSQKYDCLKQSLALAMVDGKKTDEYQSSPLKLRLRNESGTDPVYLKLVRAENGINVVACAADGSVYADGHLLNIKDDGEVTFYEYISPDFGFVLNESGSLIYNHN